MKISEVTPAQAAEYLRLPEGSFSDVELQAIMDGATAYILSYTGLPAEELGNYPDLTIAWLTLCQDMYDHRSMTADPAGNSRFDGVNRVMDTILGMHARNLI